MKDLNDSPMGQDANVLDSALNNLMECLVISFELIRDECEFRFISDYPYKSPNSMREFVGFVFHGVTDFQRKLGDQVRFYQYNDSYSSNSEVGAIVVQYLELSTMDSGKKCLEFWFGPNFGGLSFCYSRVNGFTRGSTAEKSGNDFVYSDVETGERFDFYEPFPMLKT